MRHFGRILTGFCLVLTLSAQAQTLAHKGWAGSGLTVEPWWQGAVFYQLDPISFQDSNGDGFGDLRGIANRLPYLQQLGVDALILSPFPLQPRDAAQPFDAAYGSTGDFDQLEQEAARRKMRILVDLPVRAGAGETVAQARFWLSRGVAGLRLVRDPEDANSPGFTAADRSALLRELRRTVSGYGGQRVLIWDAGDPGPGVAVAVRRGAHTDGGITQAELVGERRLAAVRSLGELRGAILPRAAALLESDGADRQRSFDRLGDVPRAKLLATAMLAGPGVPLLYFGQEIGMASTPAGTGPGDPTPMQWGGDAGFTSGVPWIEMGRNAATANVAVEDMDPDSLLNWYRQLTLLHHANAALRSGTFDLLASPNPDLLVWVRKPRLPGPTNAPALVILNLSGHTSITSLGALAGELRRVGVAGTILKTLARTAGEPAGAPMMSAISVEGLGVYVGEVRDRVGLEGVVVPVRGRRR